MSMHPLSRRKKTLVPVTPWKQQQLNDFLTDIDTLFSQHDESAKAARDATSKLKAEYQAAEQEKYLKSFNKRLDTVISQQRQSLMKSRSEIAERIERQKQPHKSDSEISQLMELLKSQEIRQELRSMSGEDKSRLVRQTAAAGDRSIIDAAKGALTELVSPKLIEAAESAYEMAVVDRNDKSQLEVVDQLVDTVDRTGREAKRYLDEKNQEYGLVPDAEVKAEVGKANVAEMNDADKAAFVSQHGLDAYRQVKRGEVSISEFTDSAATATG